MTTAGLTTAQAIVERALELSRAAECMVLVTEESTANLRWANNTLTTNGVTEGRSVTVIALSPRGNGLAAGAVSRRGLDDAELSELVAAADAASASAAEAEEAQPPLPAEQAEQADFDAAPGRCDIGVLGGFASGLTEAFRRARSDDHQLYGFAEYSVTTTYLGTSSGIRLRHEQPGGTAQLNAKSRQLGSSTWVGRSTEDFTDVDAAAMDAEVERRTRWARRRVELPAGRYETLLPPSAVADLMIDFYASAGARDAAEGRTVFADGAGGTRIGERLSDLPLRLYSDPAAAGLSCAPFVLSSGTGRFVTAFDNGWRLGATDWMSDGRLQALVQTRHSARLTGQATTPFVDNLLLELPGAARSVEDLVAGTERGLLLTCLWYIREVDPQHLLLTGLTRDGVYLVEDGEITGQVNNFRFNESPVSLLGRATEVSVTEPALPRESGDSFARTAMPALRIPDFNMSTVSKAS